MDLECQGSKVYKTPVIDNLASESVSYTNAYAAHPRCVPSRYGIMTGNYPARGEVPLKREGLNKKEKTFAQYLNQAGYTSCYIGKWHLGDGVTGPVGKGFTKSIASGHAGSPRNYFAPFNATYDKPWNIKKTPIPDVNNVKEGEYLTDVLTTKAIDFIKDNKSKPFFLMMAFYAVHEPLQAPKNLVKKYDTIISHTKFPNLPDYIKEGTGRTKMKQDNAVYAAMVENMDKNVGRILDYLKENNLDTNTIIIFTSDHGGLSNDGYKKRNLATSNYPLRAGKGWLYEGGVRVPLFIKWPGVSKPSIDSLTIVTGIDFYPTIAEITTGKKVKKDGISIVQSIKGKEISDRGPIFWYSPKARPKSTGDSNSIAIRDGNFKLIKWYETGRVELYNIKEDIGEQHDLSKKLPRKTSEMLKKLNNWKKEVAIKQ
jgi:arylsulfatase A-like enzyme